MRKVTAVLRANGIMVNHKRVARLMSDYCMHSKVRRSRRSFTEPGDGANIQQDLLKRDFHMTAPDQKMVSDTTGIRTRQGWLYVAGILDLYGRIPVGIATGTRNDTLDDAKSAVYEYVWSFYTNLRPHAANGYLTPAQFYEQARSNNIS